MIIDTLDNAHKYYERHPLFAMAFEQIPSCSEPGVREIQGKSLYAIVSRTEGEPAKDVQLEAHRKFIDIQFAARGAFNIGWRPLADCKHVAKAYDAENDYVLFEDEPDIMLTIREGTFGIFFPEDAHAPLPSTSPLIKVVMKVSAES